MRQFANHIVLAVAVVVALSFSAAAQDKADASGLEKLLAFVADLSQDYRQREMAGRDIIRAGSERALPVLTQGLASERSIVRQVSAVLLGELGDVSAEPALVGVLDKDDFITAGNARSALQKIYGRFLPGDLLGRLSGENRTPDAACAIILDVLYDKYSFPDSPAIPEDMEKLMAGLLKSNSAEVRCGAVRLLVFGDVEKSAAILIARIKDEKSSDVLAAICRSLARIRPAEGGEAVVPLAKHPDAMVSIEAAAALYGMGYGGAPDALRSQLSNPSAFVRARVLEVMGELRMPETLDAINDSFRDSSWMVRLAAVNAYANLKHPGIPEAIHALQEDEDARVRSGALLVLARNGMTGAIWSLIADLKNEDRMRRVMAINALGKLKDGRAVQPLVELLAEKKDNDLACRAAAALGCIGDKAAIAELFERLSADNPVLNFSLRNAIVELCGSDPGDSGQKWEAWADENRKFFK